MENPLNETAPETTQKKCIYCGSSIDSSAAVCPVCKYHQTWFRNAIVFWGGAAGLLTILASGILFSIDTIRNFYHATHWKDQINVHYFHTYPDNHYAIVLSNSGSGTVLVSEITVYAGGQDRYNAPFYVGRTLATGEFISIPITDFASEYVGLHGGYAANADGIPPESLIKQATINWHLNGDNGVFCYAIFFITPDAEDIQRMNEFYGAQHQKLVTSPVYAKVIYFDA